MSADPTTRERDELLDPAYQRDLIFLANGVLKLHRGELDLCYLARQTLALLERVQSTAGKSTEHRPQPRGRKEK